MTTFQRLLRGLQVLNRYSGITEVDVCGLLSTKESTLTAPSTIHQIEIPVPRSVILDVKDVTEMRRLGWTPNGNTYIFQP